MQSQAVKIATTNTHVHVTPFSTSQMFFGRVSAPN